MSSLPFLVAMEGAKVAVALSALSFLSLRIPTPGFPVAGLFLSFGLARWMHGVRLRRIWQALAHGAAFAFVVAGTGYGTYGHAWREDRTLLVTVIAVCAAFWARGLWLRWNVKPDASRSTTHHDFVVARFDEGLVLVLGVAAFAALSGLPDGGATRIAPYFAVFAALALSTSNRERDPGRTGLMTAVPTAVIASATAVAAAVALAAAQPSLRDPVRRAGVVVGGFMLAAIRAIVLFLSRFLLPGTVSNARIDEPRAFREVPMMEGPGVSVFATILGWIFIVVMGLALLALVAYLLVLLARYLWGGPGGGSRSGRRWNLLAFFASLQAGLSRWLRDMVDAISARIAAARTCILGSRRPERPAFRAWSRLVSCARVSGIRRRPAETPREFALRLVSRFPKAAADAPFVAESIGLELYGGLRADADPDRARRLGEAQDRLVPGAFLGESAVRGFRRFLRPGGPGN